MRVVPQGARLPWGAPRLRRAARTSSRGGVGNVSMETLRFVCSPTPPRPRAKRSRPVRASLHCHLLSPIALARSASLPTMHPWKPRNNCCACWRRRALRVGRRDGAGHRREPQRGVESRRGAAPEGYAIDAVTNKGYALSQENDLLSPQGVDRILPARPPLRHLRAQTRGAPPTPRRAAAPPRARPRAPSSWPRSRPPARDAPAELALSPLRLGLYLSIVLRHAGRRPRPVPHLRRRRGGRAGHRAGDRQGSPHQVGERHLLRRREVASSPRAWWTWSRGASGARGARHRREREATGRWLPSRHRRRGGRRARRPHGRRALRARRRILQRASGTCTGTWPTPRSTTSTAAGASCWANRSSCAAHVRRPRRRPHAQLQAGRRTARQNPPASSLRRGQHPAHLTRCPAARTDGRAPCATRTPLNRADVSRETSVPLPRAALEKKRRNRANRDAADHGFLCCSARSHNT